LDHQGQERDDQRQSEHDELDHPLAALVPEPADEPVAGGCGGRRLAAGTR
jgi:hypothetical protein